MTVLFSGSVPILSGPQTSATFAVPGGIKQAGKPMILRVLMNESGFPSGVTTIGVDISLNGGSSFRSASMTCLNPKTDWRGAAPHFWISEYSLGPKDNPTHARYRTDAPAGFTAAVTLEAV